MVSRHASSVQLCRDAAIAIRGPLQSDALDVVAQSGIRALRRRTHPPAVISGARERERPEDGGQAAAGDPIDVGWRVDASLLAIGWRSVRESFEPL